MSQIIEEIRTRLQELEELHVAEFGARIAADMANLPDGPVAGIDNIVNEAVRRTHAAHPEDVPLPPALNTNDFQALFREFCRHRKLKDPKDHWTPIAAQRKLAALSKLGLPEATRWVEFALNEGLKNIQEPFQKAARFGTPPKPQARPAKKCAQCGISLERSSYPSSKGDICPLCHSRS